MMKAAYIVGIITVLGISYLGWIVSRKLNYGMSYKSMVEETVREMVKQEALK